MLIKYMIIINLMILKKMKMIMNVELDMNVNGRSITNFPLNQYMNVFF